VSGITKLTRRELLALGIAAGSGLALKVPEQPAGFAPNAFLRIDETGNVTIWSTRSESGQGVRTSLPMLVAEELEVDWTSVHVVQAPFHSKFGDQNTGGSNAVRNLWNPMRKAGAAAREMLIQAAAKEWGVAKESCTAQSGAVIHKTTGRKLSYGPLSVKAMEIPVPKNPPLKNPSQFRLIGKPVHRVDTPSKVDGSARFSIAVRVP
jgi:isoquinoline 1-oxidoreductase subunit beta